MLMATDHISTSRVEVAQRTGGIGYASLSLFFPGSGLNSYYIDFTTNSATTQEFVFNPNNGELTALNGPAAAAGNPATFEAFQNGGSFVLVSDAASAAQLQDYPVICQIVSGQLQCQYQPRSQMGHFFTCDKHLVIAAAGDDIKSYCSSGTVAYSFKVYAAIVG